jgi:hypothetical protein
MKIDRFIKSRWATTLVFSAFVWLTPVLFMGCASTANQKWNSRVGSYTVKEAVKELGNPQRAVAFGDGTQVGEWLTQIGTRTAMRAHIGPTFTARAFDYTVLPREAPMIPDKYLRLLFGPDGRLVAWDRQYE